MIDYLTDKVFLVLMIKMLVIFGGLIGALAYMTLLERKVMAWVQMRPGPNRVGPFGLLQPLADGMKFLFKEDIIPTGANAMLYVLAPVVSLIPAFLVFAVIPFGPNFQITDLNVGLLFVFAMTSVGVYGIVLGGWASNSKYPLLGGLRASAQMISYELSLTLSVIGILMIANTLSLAELVRSQEGTWMGFVPRWNIFLQPIAFVIFLISSIAETNRTPFDLAEAEQELVAGWHTEYSSMKFAMFFLAEYANMITASAMATILFLGGWSGPVFGPPLLQMVLPTVWFLAKVFVFIFIYMLIRATLPRVRYDQLMAFGWKFLLPLALANVVITSFIVAVSMIETLFFLFAALALGSAINVLVQKHVLYSALSLIVMLASVSMLFGLLRADFLAVIQILVYTGAIMVLFIFVIMLLNVASDERERADPLKWLKFVGIPAGLFLLAMVSSVIWQLPGDVVGDPASTLGSPSSVGMSMFTDYLLPFEATSLLILIAIIGAVVLAKRDV